MHDKLPTDSDLLHQAQTNRDLVEGIRLSTPPQRHLSPNTEPVYGFRSEALPCSFGELALMGQKVDEVFRDIVSTDEA